MQQNNVCKADLADDFGVAPDEVTVHSCHSCMAQIFRGPVANFHTLQIIP